MFLTLLAAALAALIWTLVSTFGGESDPLSPHNPSTLELAAMAVITFAAYTWIRQVRAIRTQAQAEAADDDLSRYTDTAIGDVDEAAEHAA